MANLGDPGPKGSGERTRDGLGVPGAEESVLVKSTKVHHRAAEDIPIDKVGMAITAHTSLSLTREEKEVAQARFQLEGSGFDDPRYRFEGVILAEDKPTIQLSTGITYGMHHVLRSEETAPSRIINPATIHFGVLSSDGYFVGGTWGKGADQSGIIASALRGFIDVAGDGHPELLQIVAKQLLSKIRMGAEEGDNFKNTKKALFNTHYRQTISGKNNDTNIAGIVYAPVKAKEIQIVQGGEVFQEDSHCYISAERDSLTELLKSGEILGVPVNDIFLQILADHLERDMASHGGRLGN